MATIAWLTTAVSLTFNIVTLLVINFGFHIREILNLSHAICVIPPIFRDIGTSSLQNLEFPKQTVLNTSSSHSFLVPLYCDIVSSEIDHSKNIKCALISFHTIIIILM